MGINAKVLIFEGIKVIGEYLKKHRIWFVFFVFKLCWNCFLGNGVLIRLLRVNVRHMGEICESWRKVGDRWNHYRMIIWLIDFSSKTIYFFSQFQSILFLKKKTFVFLCDFNWFSHRLLPWSPRPDSSSCFAPSTSMWITLISHLIFWISKQKSPSC